MKTADMPSPPEQSQGQQPNRQESSLERDPSYEAPDRKLQDKIIRRHSKPDLVLDFSPELKPGERDEYLKYVAEYGDNHFLSLDLDRLATTPVKQEQDPKNPVNIFSAISGNNQTRGFVAEFAKGDFRKIDKLRPKDLGDFLSRYRNPYAYQKDAMKFLGRIEQDYSPEVAESYRQSLDIFMKNVYGDQCYKTYKQMEYLREEAESKYPQETKSKFVMSRHPEIDTQSPMLEKDKAKAIGEARSLGELDLALHRINGIKGSVDDYSVPELLMRDIEAVIEGRQPMETITRTYGLRDKVSTFAAIAKARRDLDA